MADVRPRSTYFQLWAAIGVASRPVVAPRRARSLGFMPGGVSSMRNLPLGFLSPGGFRWLPVRSGQALRWIPRGDARLGDP